MVESRYPTVTQYQCYRELLRDFYLFKKSLRPSFSYRQFNQKVGLKSPNYLQQVIEGKKNLLSATAEKVAQVLDMSSDEKSYFLALVNLDNAQSIQDKQEAKKWLLVSAKRLATQFISKAQREVLSKWHHLVVRELVLLKDFEPTGEYVSQKLGGTITPQEAEGSLTLLIQSGFIEKAKDGYQLKDPVLMTGEDVFSHHMMQKLHCANLQVWAKNIAKLDATHQDLQLLNIPISEAKLPELQEKIKTFIEEVVGLVQDEQEADQVVQLGCYLVPLKK